MGKSATAVRLLTAEEFYALPIEGPADLVAGVIIPMSPSNPVHGRLLVRLGGLLEAEVERLGLPLAVVGGDVGFVLRRGEDVVRGADIAVLEAGRYDTAKRAGGFVEGAPVLAVEVRSPSNRPGLVDQKIADYLDAGALAVWDVDPGSRTVTVRSPGAPPRRLGPGDLMPAADPLLGLAITIDRVFAGI